MMNLARALLRLHLAALDEFGAPPDQIDVGLAEDDASAVLIGHVADNAVATCFDPEGADLEELAYALAHPVNIFLPNGRILRDHEWQARLADAGNTTH